MSVREAVYTCAHELVRDCIKVQYLTVSVMASLLPRPSKDEQSQGSLFQRLEFLGDRYLKSLLLSRMLKEGAHFLNMKEQEMDRFLVTCESNDSLADAYERLRLSELIGDMNHRPRKKYADVIEAIVGELSIAIVTRNGQLVPLPEMAHTVMRRENGQPLEELETVQLTLSALIDAIYANGRAKWELQIDRLDSPNGGIAYTRGQPMRALGDGAPPLTAPPLTGEPPQLPAPHPQPPPLSADAAVALGAFSQVAGRDITVPEAEQVLLGRIALDKVCAEYPVLLHVADGSLVFTDIASWLFQVLEGRQSVLKEQMAPAQVQMMESMGDFLVFKGDSWQGNDHILQMWKASSEQARRQQTG